MAANIIAAFAAMISAYMAHQSWYYSKELSKPAVSLLDVKVEGSRVDKDKLDIKFLFIFKNVGKEKAIINVIHSEAIFNHPVNFKVIDIDHKIPDKLIGEYLQTIFEKQLGKFAIIFKLKYKGTLVFSAKELQELYFIGYKGRGAVYQITDNEYKEMEAKLPEDFKIENNE